MSRRDNVKTKEISQIFRNEGLRDIFSFYVVLAWHDNCKFISEVFLTTTIRFGSIIAVNKHKITFETSIGIFFKAWLEVKQRSKGIFLTKI